MGCGWRQLDLVVGWIFKPGCWREGLAQCPGVWGETSVLSASYPNLAFSSVPATVEVAGLPSPGGAGFTDEE